MPRNKRGGSLASYFYEAAGGDGTGSVTASGKVSSETKSSFMPATPGMLGQYDAAGKWIGPGPEPKKGRRRRTKRSKPSSEAPVRHKSARKEIIAHMQSSLKRMKENYKETEDIFESNPEWPLSDAYITIQAYILKCKTAIHAARSHTGLGRHAMNVEAVHAARIDTSNWDFASIYDPIVNFPHQGHHNHLKLPRPHHHKDGTHLFVNVVLAWLFAAKSQLMSNLAAYINDQGRRTPVMEKFLQYSHVGKEALEAYHGYKHQLTPKKPKKYNLQDATLLDEQHKALYG